MSAPATTRVPLYRLAHARAGDKGNRLNVALFAYRAQDYPLLVAQVTEEAVARRFAHRRPRLVARHLVPGLQAINFVLDDVLEGGVNRSLTLDRHGKGLAYLLLGLEIEVPDEASENTDTPRRREK